MKTDRFELTIMGSMALFAASIVGVPMYNWLGAEPVCETYFDRSWSGLYILKMERCTGALGFKTGEDRTIDKRPLFEQF